MHGSLLIWRLVILFSTFGYLYLLAFSSLGTAAGVNNIETLLQEETPKDGINNDLGIHPFKTGVFTPAEIRQKYLDEQTETLEVKRKNFENKWWDIIQGDNGQYLVVNEGIQNESNVAWLDHKGDCSFRLYFTIQQAKNNGLDQEIGLAINFRDGNIVTIYLDLGGITDEPSNETKVLYHYQSKIISWEDLWELRDMDFITFTPPAESNFDFSYEKWSFKRLPFRRNQMKQDLGCTD